MSAAENLEIDLNATKTTTDDLVLDLEGGWKQTEVAEQFGLMETGISTIAPTATLPSREAFGAAKLAQELGYEDVLTVGALEDGIRFYQQRTAEACLELGKRLLLLKELSAHGEFIKRIELLGFSQSSAKRFMGAVRKITKTPNLGDLVPKIGSQQKLLELLVLDDGDLEEIVNGGEASAVTLDEIECMTATELRNQLRQYKAGKLATETEKPLLETIQSLQKQIGNHEKLYEKQQLEIEDKTRQLNQLTRTKQPGKEALSIETMAIREESYSLEYGASVYIKALRMLLQKTLKQTAPTPDEDGLRYDAIANAVSGMYLDIDHLFQELQALRGLDAVPPELSGKHVLTDLEKQRLVDCKLMIDHDFTVKEVGRESRRADENKKAPGRPAGAKNKTQ
ncbi:hypothetical protein JCM14076_06180 [Methylosoma difficile]